MPKKGRTATSKSATAEEISKRKRVHPDGKSGEEDGEEEEEPEEPKKGKKEVSRRHVKHLKTLLGMDFLCKIPRWETQAFNKLVCFLRKKRRRKQKVNLSLSPGSRQNLKRRTNKTAKILTNHPPRKNAAKR